MSIHQESHLEVSECRPSKSTISSADRRMRQFDVQPVKFDDLECRPSSLTMTVKFDDLECRPSSLTIWCADRTIHFMSPCPTWDVKSRRGGSDCTHCLFTRARQRAPLAMYHEMYFGGSWGPTNSAGVLMANRHEKQPDRKESGPTNQKDDCFSARCDRTAGRSSPEIPTRESRPDA